MVVGGHDALGRRGSRSVHVSLPFPFALPFPVPVSGGPSVLLPLPVVGRLVADGRGFALVLAGVLMQDVQGFGVRGGFGDGGAGARFVADFLPSGYFTPVWREGVTSG